LNVQVVEIKAGKGDEIVRKRRERREDGRSFTFVL